MYLFSVTSASYCAALVPGLARVPFQVDPGLENYTI
jgi:hypothetical protein